MSSNHFSKPLGLPKKQTPLCAYRVGSPFHLAPLLQSTHHLRFPFVSVVWKTLEADMRFSMYWPRTWFSDFNFRFSSFTASTRADRSGRKTDNEIIQYCLGSMWCYFKKDELIWESIDLKAHCERLSGI